MNYARQNTTHYRCQRSLQNDRPLGELHLPMLPPRRRTAAPQHKMRKSHQDTYCRDTRLDSEMRKGVIMTRKELRDAAIIVLVMSVIIFPLWACGVVTFY